MLSECLIDMWFKAYIVAWFLSGIAGSIYYTYSRPYLMERLGASSYYIVGILLAAEQIPAVLSIVSGFLADYFGRRKLLLIGYTDLALYPIMGYVEPTLIPMVIGIKTLMGSLIGPAVTGTVLHATNRSGYKYSLLAMASTIGWVLGGIVPGLLINLVGSAGLFILAGLLSGLSTSLQYIFYPNIDAGGEKIALSDLETVFNRTWDLLLINTLANASLSLFFTMVSLKIYGELNNLLIYGVALSSSTALAGAFVRPLSGKLVDKYDPVKIIILSLTAYIIVDTGLYISSGLPLIILWILPIYPFRDTATTIALSRRVPLRLQSTMAGFGGLTAFLSGLLVLLINQYAHGDVATVFYIHMAILLASTTLLTLLRNREYDTFNNA